MHHSVLFPSGGFLGNTHVENEMPVFVSLECKAFHETMLLVFLIAQVIFVCIFWNSYQSSSLWNIFNMLFVCGMDVSRAK